MAGHDLAAARRSDRTKPEHLARGPAGLASVLGLAADQNGADLCAADSALSIRAGLPTPPDLVRVGSAGRGECRRRAAVALLGGAAPPRCRPFDRACGAADQDSCRGPEWQDELVPDQTAPAPQQPASVLDDLRWRGLIAQSTDEFELATALPAARSPSTAASTRPPEACTSATSCCCSPCAGSRRPGTSRSGLVGGATGPDRRSADVGRAGAERTGGGGRVGSSHPDPGGEVPRLQRPARRPHRQQSRLDRADERHRLPPRRRQALPDGPDAVEGDRLGPAEQRRRPVLHRVQLPDPAGHGLPRAEPPVRLRAATRRATTSGET